MAISSKSLNPGEKLVLTLRTHPKALLRPLLILILALAAAVAVQVLVDVQLVAWIAWGLAAVVIVVWSLWPFLEWVTAGYAITNRRVITQSGVITRKGHDLSLNRITNVEYELGLIDRMLGCGTLVVSDASSDGEVTLHDIPKVEDVQRTLNQLLHESGDPGSRT